MARKPKLKHFNEKLYEYTFSGTLAEIKQRVDELFVTYGGDANISFYNDGYETGSHIVEIHWSRPITKEEIAHERAEKAAQDELYHRRTQQREIHDYIEDVAKNQPEKLAALVAQLKGEQDESKT